MGLIKNIVKYIFILLLIALGIVVLACSVLLLFPEVNIFGFKYVFVNQKFSYMISASETFKTADGTNETPTSKYFANLLNVTEIEVDAGNVNVTIRPHYYDIANNRQAFIIESLIQANGFAQIPEGKEVAEMYATYKPEITEILDQDDQPTGKYKIKIVNETADGVINLTHKYLNITIPKDLSTHLENLKISTRNGSIIVNRDADEPNNNTKITVSNMTTLQSTNGDINMHYIKMNNLTATSNNGKMIFYDGVDDITGTVRLHNNNGKIEFKEGVNFLGKCYIESGISRIKINDIVGEFEYKGESAFLEVGKVTGAVTIYSANAVVNIDEISGEHSSLFAGYDETSETNYNRIGNRIFRIKKIDFSEVESPDLFLETNTGEISIDELITQGKSDAPPYTSILTETGNITIKNLVGGINTVTKRGNIKITQGKYGDYPSKIAVLRNAVIQTTCETGNVVLKNIVGKLDVKTTSNGNSPIDIELLEVNHSSKIYSGSGTMNLKLPTQLEDGTRNKYAFTFTKAKENESDELVKSKGTINIDLFTMNYVGADKYYKVQLETSQLLDDTDDETGSVYYSNTAPEGVPILNIYTKGGTINISQYLKPYLN